VVRVTAENRRIALETAERLAGTLGLDDADGVVSAAGKFYRFLDATHRLVAVVWVDGAPYIFPEGAQDMATIPVAANVDNNTVTFKVLPQDDHGDTTADQLSWSSDDTAGTTGTLAVDDDTDGAVLTLNHVEGTVNVTVSDPSSPGVEDLVFAVTVGAGATSALSGTATVA
jgi:hypothetical protein